MQKIVSSLLAVLLATAVCGQGKQYPDVIYPRELLFDYSVNEYKIEQEVKADGYHHNERAGIVIDSGRAHLAIYEESSYWNISRQLFSGSFDSYTLSFVDMDGEDNYELLVRAVRKEYNHIYYNEYLLVDIDKKLAWPLKEYCSDGYFTQGAITPDIRIWPGKVRFEYINGSGCSIDNLSIAEYKLGKDTLYKHRLLPGFKNLSAPFSTNAVLKGRVGKEPVTMHLSKELGYYHGYYYYDRDKRHIRLSDNSYFDKTAPVVFKRYDSDTVLRGLVTDTSFIGICTDGKRADSFHLSAVYNKENIRLRKYSFKDSVVWHNGARFDLSTSYYLADTAAMSKEEAIAFNTALFGEWGGLYYCEPHAAFRNFRDGVLKYVDDELFRHADDVEMYTSTHWSVRYNKNGLFCAQVYQEEYMGGARPGHAVRTILYDADRQQNIDYHDILSCPDSVLCDIAKEVYKEFMKGGRQEIDTFKLETECLGAVILTSGGFTVFVHELPLEEYLTIPFTRLEKYIRPEYRKRLMK